MAKVNLDALIPREDFEVKDTLEQNTGRNTQTILKDNSCLFVISKEH